MSRGAGTASSGRYRPTDSPFDSEDLYTPFYDGPTSPRVADAVRIAFAEACDPTADGDVAAYARTVRWPPVGDRGFLFDVRRERLCALTYPETLRVPDRPT
jgi:hypothetical protein